LSRLLTRPLLFTDLDGTLITGRDALSRREFSELVSLLGRYGGEVIVATARPPHDVLRLLGPKTPRFDVICSDGGVEFECYHGRIEAIRHESHLSLADAMRASTALGHAVPNVDLLFFAGSAHQFEVRILRREQRSSLAPDRILALLGDERPQRVYPTEENSLFACIRSVAALIDTATAEAMAEKVVGRWPGLQWLIYPETRLPDAPSRSWVEAAPLGMSKGATASRIAETASLVMVAGNAANDLPLFEIADVSFCPSDAEPVARSAADHILAAAGGTPFLVALRETASRYLRDWTKQEGHVV
jgi:hydroxymethylpyrimidine pyrophosphatase-like HAD family hydrolase